MAQKRFWMAVELGDFEFMQLARALCHKQLGKVPTNSSPALRHVSFLV
jgi:hypothetical protein